MLTTILIFAHTALAQLDSAKLHVSSQSRTEGERVETTWNILFSWCV